MRCFVLFEKNHLSSKSLFGFEMCLTAHFGIKLWVFSIKVTFVKVEFRFELVLSWQA